MRKHFKIIKDYYDIGEDLYAKNEIIIESGVTPLVGCNGSGKTTFLQQIKYQLKKEEIPFIVYDNLSDGGSHARAEAGFTGDMSFLATSIYSSEGENIFMNLSKFSQKIGEFVRKNQDKKELFVLLDAIDSGLSIDSIDGMNSLFNLIINDCESKGIDMYILVSANTYELCRNKECFDIYHGECITFKDYEEYRAFILDSSKIKENR